MKSSRGSFRLRILGFRSSRLALSADMRSVESNFFAVRTIRTLCGLVIILPGFMQIDDDDNKGIASELITNAIHLLSCRGIQEKGIPSWDSMDSILHSELRGSYSKSSGGL